MPASVSAPSFHRPVELAAALELLAQPGAVALSGGTDFYPARLNATRDETIVDITGIDELRGIAQTDNGWRIGAATTWSDITRHTLPPAFAGLQAAARQIGGVQIQNVGTIAGNLCTASPAGDGIPPLLTLDARIELRSQSGTRTIALTEFVNGYRTTALHRGELVTAIIVPEVPRSSRAGFVKLGSRSYLVISIAMVATVVIVEDDHIAEARIAVGACSPVATRLTALERHLRGCPLDGASIAARVGGCRISTLAPLDDIRGSAVYRNDVVPQLIVDALTASLTTEAVR